MTAAPLSDVESFVSEQFDTNSQFLKESGLTCKDLNFSMKRTIDWLQLAGDSELNHVTYLHEHWHRIEISDDNYESAILTLLRLNNARENTLVNYHVDLTLTAEPTMIDANKVRFDCKLHCQAQTWQVSSRRDATFIYSNEELVNITDKIESMSIRETVDYFARAANVSVVEAPLRAFQMNFTAIQCRFNEEDLARIETEEEAYAVFEIFSEHVAIDADLLTVTLQLEGNVYVPKFEHSEEFSFEIEIKRDIAKATRLHKQQTKDFLKRQFSEYHKPRKAISYYVEKQRISKNELYHLYHFSKYAATKDENASLLRFAIDPIEIDINGQTVDGIVRMSICEAKLQIELRATEIADVLGQSFDFEPLEDFYIYAGDRYRSKEALIEALSQN